MNNLMRDMLGDDWHKLPPALQAHYRDGNSIEAGHMDIEYPAFMQPALMLLRSVGALIDRRGKDVMTVVTRTTEGERLLWHRAMTYPDGRKRAFDSFWVPAGGNRLQEFINAVLGLEMAVTVTESGGLQYRGLRYVMKLGSLRVPIPSWAALGDVSIVEEAISATRYRMDFRIRHPLLGQVFRYAGEFTADPGEERYTAAAL
jgi:hypothetical protein